MVSLLYTLIIGHPRYLIGPSFVPQNRQEPYQLIVASNSHSDLLLFPRTRLYSLPHPGSAIRCPAFCCVIDTRPASACRSALVLRSGSERTQAEAVSGIFGLFFCSCVFWPLSLFHSELLARVDQVRIGEPVQSCDRLVGCSISGSNSRQCVARLDCVVLGGTDLRAAIDF